MKKALHSLPSLLPFIGMISILFVDVEENSLLFFSTKK